ncbi:MAG: hypothetical protein LBS86_00260 [Treponema sp.]|nr:hypothetical protein [Treponema sp.]
MREVRIVQRIFAAAASKCAFRGKRLPFPRLDMAKRAHNRIVALVDRSAAPRGLTKNVTR